MVYFNTSNKVMQEYTQEITKDDIASENSSHWTVFYQRGPRKCGGFLRKGSLKWGQFLIWKFRVIYSYFRLPPIFMGSACYVIRYLRKNYLQCNTVHCSHFYKYSALLTGSLRSDIPYYMSGSAWVDMDKSHHSLLLWSRVAAGPVFLCHKSQDTKDSADTKHSRHSS